MALIVVSEGALTLSPATERPKTLTPEAIWAEVTRATSVPAGLKWEGRAYSSHWRLFLHQPFLSVFSHTCSSFTPSSMKIDMNKRSVLLSGKIGTEGGIFNFQINEQIGDYKVTGRVNTTIEPITVQEVRGLELVILPPWKSSILPSFSRLSRKAASSAHQS